MHLLKGEAIGTQNLVMSPGIWIKRKRNHKDEVHETWDKARHILHRRGNKVQIVNKDGDPFFANTDTCD